MIPLNEMLHGLVAANQAAYQTALAEGRKAGRAEALAEVRAGVNNLLRDDTQEGDGDFAHCRTCDGDVYDCTCGTFNEAIRDVLALLEPTP